MFKWVKYLFRIVSLVFTWLNAVWFYCVATVWSLITWLFSLLSFVMGFRVIYFILFSIVFSIRLFLIYCWVLCLFILNFIIRPCLQFLFLLYHIFMRFRMLFNFKFFRRLRR